MRTLSRPRHVVLAIVCPCSRAFEAGRDRNVRQRGLLAGKTLRPAREPYRHKGTLPRRNGLPSPSEFSSSCMKLGTGMPARRHCRRSQQEIKCCFGRYLPAALPDRREHSGLSILAPPCIVFGRRRSHLHNHARAFPGNRQFVARPRSKPAAIHVNFFATVGRVRGSITAAGRSQPGQRSERELQ